MRDVSADDSRKQKLLLSINYTVICEIGILINGLLQCLYSGFTFLYLHVFFGFTSLFLICLSSGGSARGEHCNGQPHLGYESCAPTSMFVS